jgi:hypothetical protein
VGHPPNHDHTITVRQVSGQGVNVFGHATVQIDSGKEVGYGPKKDGDPKVVENKEVSGQVEPRAAGVKTEDQVTIHVTADQAKAAQTTIDGVAKNPGNYQLDGNNCARFAEKVVNGAGGSAPNDVKPGALVNDMAGGPGLDSETWNSPTMAASGHVVPAKNAMPLSSPSRQIPETPF